MSTEGPKYHMHEDSGRMSRIVYKFLKDIPLNQLELDCLRWYVHQWVRAMPRKPADYETIKIMMQDELKEYCFHTLLEWGIDPF